MPRSLTVVIGVLDECYHVSRGCMKQRVSTFNETYIYMIQYIGCFIEPHLHPPSTAAHPAGGTKDMLNGRRTELMVAVTLYPVQSHCSGFKRSFLGPSKKLKIQNTQWTSR